MAAHFQIFESIRDDLARVEEKLREKPQLEYEVLTVAIEHLLSSGGKRIRPALVILASRLYSPEIGSEAHCVGRRRGDAAHGFACPR